MTIILRPRPDDDRVLESITYANSDDVTPLIFFIEHGDGSPAIASHPYPVYFSDAERMTRGRFFEEADFAGWQYVVYRGSKVLAAAGASEVGVPPELAYTSLENQQMAEDIVRAINRADDAAQRETRDFELRLLKDPGLFLRAIWLRSEASEGDLLFVLENAPAGLIPDRSYTRDQLIDALQPVATNPASAPDEFPRGEALETDSGGSS
jgi:hypothetical protein